METTTTAGWARMGVASGAAFLMAYIAGALGRHHEVADHLIAAGAILVGSRWLSSLPPRLYRTVETND